MEKVNYTFSPYTFARISAMKGLLLKKADYDRLMKMDLHEIIKYLQDTAYRDEINSLAVKHSGVTLLERALTANLIGDLLKIKTISSSGIRLLVDQYLRRYDYWNIKTILRAKQSNTSELEMLDIVVPVGKLTRPELKKIYLKPTIRDILVSSRLITHGNLRKAMDEYESSKNLAELENLLDYSYYLDSLEFAGRLPAEGRLFKEFFKYEVDIHDIKLALRKAYFKLGKESISPYLINGGHALSGQIVLRLAGAENVDGVREILKNTEFDKVLGQADKKIDPLIAYEMELDRFLLEKSLRLVDQKLLSVDVLLGYMFSKEIEIRNIRAISKSKRFGIDESKIRKMVLI